MMTKAFLLVLLIVVELVAVDSNGEGERPSSHRRNRGRQRNRDREQSSVNHDTSHGRVFRQLFHYYDREYRPDFGAEPVQVSVGMKIEELRQPDEGPAYIALVVSESWQDGRFQSDDEEMTFHRGAETVNMIWTPETYFSNLKGMRLLRAPGPLDKVSLSTFGHITHVYRIDGRISCTPEDCSIKLDNFRYPSTDVVYTWLDEDDHFSSDYQGLSVTSTETLVREITRSYTGPVSQLELKLHIEE